MDTEQQGSISEPLTIDDDPKTITISKEIEFDAGHRVPNHQSKCRNPHGHRYRVVVSCCGTIITEAGAADEGMLIDFGHLKILMKDLIHDPLDHGFLVYENDQDLLQCFEFWDPENVTEGAGMDPPWKIIRFPYIPTAENIALWCWEQIGPPIELHFRNNLWLSAIEVFETPTSSALYQGH